MQKRNIAIGVIVSLVLVGLSFYGGMRYQNAKDGKLQIVPSDKYSGSDIGGGANVRQRMSGSQSGQRTSGMRPGGNGEDFVGGEIISKDENGMTLKAKDGSSKIIFFTSSTTIDKSVNVQSAELEIGQQISANGKISPDGSMTAQNIIIRPNLK